VNRKKYTDPERVLAIRLLLIVALLWAYLLAFALLLP